MPLTATVRFLPIGRRGVTPYVGGGIGAFNWHYSEVGEFIFQNDVTDNDRFVADGWAAGPVVLGGIRFPVSDVWTVGGEIRWQKAVGEGLIDQNEFFLGDKIDLGGWNYELYGPSAVLTLRQLPSSNPNSQRSKPGISLGSCGVGSLGVDRSSSAR